MCEICTVSANVGQDLQPHDEIHPKLLAFERMRMIDTFNHWSRNTVSTYRYAIWNLMLFEAEFGLKALHPTIDPTTIPHPCIDPAVTFGWATLYKSDIPSKFARGNTVGYTSLHHMRSASVVANTFATALIQPTNYFRDTTHRLLGSTSVAHA